MANSDYVLRFNRSIGDFFQDAVRISVKHPALAAFLVSTTRRQRAAARLRLNWERQGVHVPPFMIASITGACNLKCQGCYAHAQGRECAGEMSLAEIRRLVEEAAELGISIILPAGGEPLTRPGILDVTRGFPGIVFPMFTDGLLIDDAVLEELTGQRNLVPVIRTQASRTCRSARL